VGEWILLGIEAEVGLTQCMRSLLPNGSSSCFKFLREHPRQDDDQREDTYRIRWTWLAYTIRFAKECLEDAVYRFLRPVSTVHMRIDMLEVFCRTNQHQSLSEYLCED
jgi:hypothetical protein